MCDLPQREPPLRHGEIAVYPSLRHVLLLSFLAFPLSQFLVYPLLSEYSQRLGLTAAELVLAGLAGLAIRNRGWIPEDVLLLNAVPRRALLALPMAAIGAAVLVGEFDHGLERLLAQADMGVPLALQRTLLEMQLVTGSRSLVLTVVSVVVVPAICEEAFFRGFVLTGLMYHHGPITAIVGSALVFAAAHLNPWQFPALFMLGLFLAAVVHWTHSVYPAVIGHAINNGLSVLAVNVRAHTGGDWLGASDPLPAAAVTAAAGAVVLGARLLLRQQPVMPLLSPYARPAPSDGVPAPTAWR